MDSKAFQQTSPSKQASPPAQHSSFQAPHPIPSSFTSPSPVPPHFLPISTPNTHISPESSCSQVHMQVGCFWWPWCQQHTNMMQQTQWHSLPAALNQGGTHTKGKRGKGRGKREEEGLKTMYANPCSSSVWLDMPTVSFLRSPQKSLQNSGLCEGFCKIDKVVLQIERRNGWRVKGSQSCSERESPGNSRKWQKMSSDARVGEKKYVTFPRVESTLEKMGDTVTYS